MGPWTTHLSRRGTALPAQQPRHHVAGLRQQGGGRPAARLHIGRIAPGVHLRQVEDML